MDSSLTSRRLRQLTRWLTAAAAGFALVTLRIAEMAEHRRAVVVGIAPLELEPAADERIAAARIDDELRAQVEPGDLADDLGPEVLLGGSHGEILPKCHMTNDQ